MKKILLLSLLVLSQLISKGQDTISETEIEMQSELNEISQSVVVLKSQIKSINLRLETSSFYLKKSKNQAFGGVACMVLGGIIGSAIVASSDINDIGENMVTGALLGGAVGAIGLGLNISSVFNYYKGVNSLKERILEE